MTRKVFEFVEKAVDKKIDVLCNGQLFTSYIYPESLMKPVLFPVFSPGNHRITRGFPLLKIPGERIDHPHHAGIWFNYGDVNGLDFWNHSPAVPQAKKAQYGTIRHREVLAMRETRDFARLVVVSDWLKPDGSQLLEEETEFCFSGAGNYRMIDRSATLRARFEDVRFRDNKEGLIAIRVARELEHPSEKPELFTDASGRPTEVPALNNKGVNGHYYSSTGEQGEAVWGTRSEWMNLAGRIGDEEISLILIDAPDNPGYPTYWHARGYGLFAANPLGQEAMSKGKEIFNFTLAKGRQVTFKYRFVIHSGARPDQAFIRRHYLPPSEPGLVAGE